MTGGTFVDMFSGVGKSGDWYAIDVLRNQQLDARFAALLGAGAVSNTPHSLATGSKEFADLSPAAAVFPTNMRVRIRRRTDAATFMLGTVTSDGTAGSVTVTVDAVNGTVTSYSDWLITADVVASPHRHSVRTLTGAGTIGAADHGNLIRCAGTFTLATESAATLGEGFRCWVVVTSGSVTVNPAGSEEVEDASTVVLAAGQGAEVGVDNGEFRFFAAKGYGSSSDLVNDTTPQLGGGLDVNGQTITSVSNGDVAIQPNGTGKVALADKVLSRPEILDYAESVNALGNTGTSKTIDLELGNAVTATLTGNCTFTFSNPPASGKMGSFTFYLLNDGTAGRTTTWPAAVKWAGGSQPSRDTGSNAKNLYTFVTFDGGTTWFGSLAIRGAA